MKSQRGRYRVKVQLASWENLIRKNASSWISSTRCGHMKWIAERPWSFLVSPWVLSVTKICIVWQEREKASKKVTRWKNAKRVHLQWCWLFGGGANVGHFTRIFDVFKCFYGVHFSDVEILFLLIFTLFHVWVMGSSSCLHLCYSVQCANSKTFQNCKGNPWVLAGSLENCWNYVKLMV